jgi:RNA polymerase sigma-70 factor (ECF subfamily)
MNERELLVDGFEANRPHLQSVAYRILGSPSEADDAVQEAWLRASRADTSAVENLQAWLTTVVACICLNMLHSRKARHEEPFDTYVPDPIVSRDDGADPEHEAVLADSVGLALLVVLETLSPAERLAIVLHDVFALSFEEIGEIVGRSPAATRQLASRARRRVQGAPVPDTDVNRQREVVGAFLAASRGGDFEGLLAVLDPDAVRRADGGTLLANMSGIVRGASAIAGQAVAAARRDLTVQLALVNGAPGIVSWNAQGEPFAVMGFTVAGGRIVEIDVLLDPERLNRLDLAALRR